MSELLDAVAMAAGMGRRMGGRPKALLQHGGEALLARQIRLLGEIGVQRIAIALGHHARRIEQLLDSLVPAPHTTLLRALNPAPEDDPGSSLRCALQALPADGRAVMVVLGDQPLLQQQDLLAMHQAWLARTSGIDLVVPQHAGQPGHPIVLGPAVRQAVLQDGTGVRTWRRAHPERVQCIDFDHARYTTDLDTPQDIARIAQTHDISLQWPADLRD